MGRRGPRQRGEVVTYTRANGLVTYSLRVPFEDRRIRVRLGDETDGWTRARATIELRNVMARIEAGVWEPPADDPPPQPSTFHEFASRWLARREHELKPNTLADYRWRLTRHLLPFFAQREIVEINADLLDRYKEMKLRERRDVLAAGVSGMALRDIHGRRLRPLSNESINKTLALLGAILDDAVRKKLLAANPVRERGVLLKAPRPRRSILEADELVDLIQAGAEIDRRQTLRGLAVADEIVRLRDVEGRTWKEIAAETGLPVSTASHHYRAGRAAAAAVSPRQAVLAALGWAGLRANELCALNWSDIDFNQRRIHLADAKTPTGVREVDMSPKLVRTLQTYKACLGEAAPDSPAFPTRSGARRTRSNLARRVVQPAARRADARRAARGLPPLPEDVTPHTLRRTYISLLLEAGAPLPYVMQQVGHADSSTTLEIYARVLKKRDRASMGLAFDDLLGT